MADTSRRTTIVHHPIYNLNLPRWIQLADARSGEGGFSDGSYLVPHPREWLDHTLTTTTNGVTTTIMNPNPKKESAKLKARRALASYNNVAAAILDAFKGPLFRQPPIRRLKESQSSYPIQDWWDDVAYGRPIDACMPAWWDTAASLGHVVLVFELPEEDVDTAADQGLPRICWYAPQDVVNWLEDSDGNVTAIKVREVVPTTDIDARLPVLRYRYRVLDAEGWQLYDWMGTIIDQGEHGLGRVPFVYLYGQEHPLTRAMGLSILGDPQNHIDLYNLESEKREILRLATFPFINVPLGTGDTAMSVEEAQTMMGKQSGTMNVLFSASAASILQPDSTSVDAYERAMSNKRREIYRSAGVQWESDSKDAEALGSLQLKREEMNTRLSTAANFCQQAERELADLFYRWQYGPDAAETRMEQDELLIQYPDHFEEAPFDQLVQEANLAILLNMPTPVMKELRKLLLQKFEGISSLTPAQQQELQKAIDAMPDDPTPQERLQARLSTFGKPGMKPGTPAPGAPQPGMPAEKPSTAAA